MAAFRPKEDSWGQGSVLSTRGTSSHSRGDWQHPSRPLRRWLDSFRRDPGRHVTPASAMNAPEDHHTASALRRSDDDDNQPPLDRASTRSGRQWRPYFDMHAANVNTANTLLSRELKSRHLQMIAIGGSIGRQTLWVTE